MKMKNFVVLLFLILFQVQSSWEWSFFSSNNDKNSDKKKEINSENHMFSRDTVSEFSMEAFHDNLEIKKLEDAKMLMSAGKASCWEKAYQSLFTGCSQFHTDEESRNRFAWRLTECFLQLSGQESLPYCNPKSPVEKCLKAVDHSNVKGVYLQYHIETNSICHRLQIEAFRRQTERLVNELKKTAEYAEGKLENIEIQGEGLLETSKEVYDSISKVDTRTQELQEATKKVENHVKQVFNYTKEIYEQSKEIEASQLELIQGQVNMKVNIEEGMKMVQDSYKNLGGEINNLRIEAIEIEKEISNVGDIMFSKMDNLKSKTDNIGIMAETSIDKQKQLLDGQSLALNGLHLLTEFQSKALEESRGALQQLAEFGHKQQQELLQRQEQLQQAQNHLVDHLVENSKTILAAQEAFESKQTKMFVALDKLFAIHNAMLLESRLIKAFLVYSLAIFLIYMFTGTKQTYNVRPGMYIGLCVTFLVELVVLRTTANDIEKQGWMINLVRSLYLVLGSSQLLYSVYTYRDYEVLNHQLLITLMEKVNRMQKGNDLMWNSDSDSDIEWSSWVDQDLSEDIDSLQDPDYLCHEEIGEIPMAETSIIKKRYNLRNFHN